MKPTHLFPAILLVFIAGNYLSAQTELPPKKDYHIYLNANLQAGLPTGEWADNVNRMAIGTGGLLLFQIGPKPIFSLGGELGWQYVDGESRKFNSQIVGGFNQDFRLTTNTGLVTAHLVGRIKPQVDFWMQPYVDLAFGTKGIFTTSQLIEASLGQQANSRFEEADFAMSYGGAVGLLFQLFNDESILIDLRCAYLAGGEATYYTRINNNPDPIVDPIDAFELRTSKTSMLMPQVGITIDISNR